jgi:hypothetical protein
MLLQPQPHVRCYQYTPRPASVFPDPSPAPTSTAWSLFSIHPPPCPGLGLTLLQHAQQLANKHVTVHCCNWFGSPLAQWTLRTYRIL